MENKDREISEEIEKVPPEEDCPESEGEKESHRSERLDRLFSSLLKISNFLFSEKFTAVLLSLMSIIISYFAWQNDTTSRIIANKELEILENDREAYFTISGKENVSSEDDGKTYVNNYTVSNEGGRISGVYIYPSSHIEMVVSYSGPAPKGTIDDDTVYFAETYTISLPEDRFGIYESYFKAYDSTSKTFTVYSKESVLFFEFLDMIEAEIHSANSNMEASSMSLKKLKISYCNYENNIKEVEYVFNDDYLYANPEENNGNYLDYVWHTHGIPYEFTDYAKNDAKAISELIMKDFNQCLIDHLASRE